MWRYLALGYSLTACTFNIVGGTGEDFPTEEIPYCESEDPAVQPFAEEIIDGIDNDCDKVIDETLTEQEAWELFFYAIVDYLETCGTAFDDPNPGDIDEANFHVNNSRLAECLFDLNSASCDELPDSCGGIFMFMESTSVPPFLEDDQLTNPGLTRD